MTQRVIAFTGISGVGKTTFLRKLAKLVPFQHLIGGDLIASARKAKSTPQDSLRFQDLDENQNLLVDGFALKRDASLNMVIVDGHAIIDNGEQLIRIPSEVFSALKTTMLIHLEAEPKAIASNRTRDMSRERPIYDAGTLKIHQEASRSHAISIAEELGINFEAVTHDDLIRTSEYLKD